MIEGIKNYWKTISIAAGIVIIAAVFVVVKNISNKPSEKILEETSKMKNSKNSAWWLNSGGIMIINGNVFSTNLGRLTDANKWRKLYAKTNPEDTDNGYKPQNIFRLVNRNKYLDYSQSVYFYINNINLSESKNRNESNGVLLFNRYQNGDNLYYTGLRVDGDAVIKKKINGKYYTMAEKAVLTYSGNYDRMNSYNLIPTNTWLGLKSEVKNVSNDTVNIKLFVDFGNKGEWQLVLERDDKDDNYGKSAFLDEGYAGIRTDFMDVKFKDYEIIKN